MTTKQARQKVAVEGGFDAVKVWETYHLMAAYGWSEGRVKQMMTKGLPMFYDGRQRRFDPRVVDSWLRNNFFVSV